jgi:hypothetical protein
MSLAVDEERACNMTNIAILIGSWINPALREQHLGRPSFEY